MNPTLSLVTPSLNQVDYLRQCLASVRALGDVEHVVSDGASTDGTVELLRGRGVAYRSGRDGGMYEAVNAGLALTHGEILGYVNCDDLLLPWAATCVKDAFRAHPEADLLVGDSLEVRGERAAMIVHPPASLLPAFLRRGGYLVQPAVFFRRALWERLGGFDPQYRLLADHDFWLRALASGATLARVWEVLAVQRMVDGQLMQKHAQRAREEEQRIQRAHGVTSQRVNGLASALLHRSALLALGADRLGLPGPGPWPRARRQGLLELTSARAWLRAVTLPSAEVAYARLGARAQAVLFPPA